MIAIIDYDAGNIKSVIKALNFLGVDPVLTSDEETLLKADKVILPGVGAFGDAMEKLEGLNLVPVIKKIVDKGTPFLGICLGLQLLFEESEEAPGVKGLSLLKGKIIHFPTDKGLKVPQIGWNSLALSNDGRLFKDVKDGSYVYFVHSYYLKAENEKIVTASSDYAAHLHASVECGNIFGCQFHPEKSSDVGLKILKNFIEL